MVNLTHYLFNCLENLLQGSRYILYNLSGKDFKLRIHSFAQHFYICFELEYSPVFFILSTIYIVILGDAQILEDESTKVFARKVADHYSARTNQTLEERENSPIIHLKKLNNWVGIII